MGQHHELEYNLLHIKAAISLLEQTRAYLSIRTPVSDPAYWKAKLKAALDAGPRDRALEALATELFDRLQKIQADMPSRKH